MWIKISRATAALLAGLAVAGVTSFAPTGRAASPPKEAINQVASEAVAAMGKSLRADQFSFRAQTLRTYPGPGGEPLHIGHTLNVTVHRPDKVMIDVTGDDGETKLYYDGKTVVLYGVDTNKYVTIPAPATIQAMMAKVMGEMGVDFPLADFVTDAPDKSFLYGVKTGQDVGVVKIDGVPCVHLLFVQPPGIELELWVEKNDKALPRRLFVTYRDMPGQPSFIAQFSDWNFDIHPTDANFTFQPPAGAVQIDLQPGARKAPVKP